MMSTSTVHCRCEDETAKERTGHPTSHAEAKKIKSLKHYIYDVLRAKNKKV